MERKVGQKEEDLWEDHNKAVKTVQEATRYAAAFCIEYSILIICEDLRKGDSETGYHQADH